MYRRTWRKDERKRVILGVLARAQRPLAYSEVAGALGIYPIRQVATDLAKFTRWRYLRRWKAAGKFRYEITRRGRERFTFFTRQVRRN